MAIGALIGLTIGSLIGAVLLRAAISAANKILGPQAPSQAGPIEAEPIMATTPPEPVESAAPTDPANPYSAPAMAANAGTASGAEATLAIPHPTFGKALGIAAVMSILSFVLSFAMGVVGQTSKTIALLAPLFSLSLNFLVTSFVLSKMLPTTFARSILVYVMYVLIALLIAVVVGGIGFVLFRLA